MSYVETIETTIDDQECLIGVIDFKVVKGTFNPNEESSDDYYGYCELDWEILNLDGTKNPELELILNDEDRIGIEDVIHDYMERRDA